MNNNIEDALVINEVYSKMVELTDGETDDELKHYYETLLDKLQESIQYVNFLEKEVKKKDVMPHENFFTS